MCGRLASDGVVEAGYAQSVLRRERVGKAVIGKGIAIPHGDPRLVRRSTVAVAVLQQPVEWDDNEAVDLVFLLALDQNEDFSVSGSLLSFYRTLLSLVEDDEYRALLKRSEQPSVFIDRLEKRFE